MDGERGSVLPVEWYASFQIDQDRPGWTMISAVIPSQARSHHCWDYLSTWGFSFSDFHQPSQLYRSELSDGRIDC